MDLSTHIKPRNVDRFLRKFAPEIDRSKLVPVERRFSPSIVFYYGNDRILKVPKPGARREVTKEFRVVAHLNTQTLPVVIPEAIDLHPEGLYAVFSRLDVERLTPDRMDAFAEPVAAFLSFLHRHEFPDDLLGRLDRAPSLDDQLRAARRKIAFIRNHVPDLDVVALEARLDNLEHALDTAWVVRHCDFSESHVLALRGNDRFGVIDFADADVGDPSVDVNGLPDELSGGDEDLYHRILSALLAHYDTDDENLARKVDFQFLCDRVGQVHRQARGVLRRAKNAFDGGEG